MSTLVTGFGSFGEIQDNPSEHLARASGRDYVSLPVSYAAADDFVDRIQVDRILMLGVAASRTKICPEIMAKRNSGDTPDITGESRPGFITAGGPAVLGQSFWSPAALAHLLMNPEVATSSDAGDYLCNYLFYAVRSRRPEVAAAFLHVPTFEVIPFEQQLKILRLALNHPTRK